MNTARAAPNCRLCRNPAEMLKAGFCAVCAETICDPENQKHAPNFKNLAKEISDAIRADGPSEVETTGVYLTVLADDA